MTQNCCFEVKTVYYTSYYSELLMPKHLKTVKQHRVLNVYKYPVAYNTVQDSTVHPTTKYELSDSLNKEMPYFLSDS